MRISRAGAPSGGDGVWVAVPTSLEGLWGKPEPRSALRGQGPAVRLCWGNQAPTAEQSLHTGPQNPSTGERPVISTGPQKTPLFSGGVGLSEAHVACPEPHSQALGELEFPEDHLTTSSSLPP